MALPPEPNPESPPPPFSWRHGDHAAALRMIDANLNRAREALRTLEDLARFVMEDADRSGQLKTIRHELGAVADSAGWDSLSLNAHRDTPADPGTGITTLQEQRRESLGAIASAAGSRAAEALRVLEEAAKLTSPNAGARIESLRYSVYTLASQIVLGLGHSQRRQWSLCVLLTESACTHHAWDQVAHMACEGGADCLQLREKDLPDGELLQRAIRLREITRRSGASLVVNDRPDIALLAEADGVHVGQEDLPASEVRRLVGGTLLIGVSTANMAQARAAAASGADVCGLGPMYASATKPKPSLSGPDYLRAFLADPLLGGIPHLAISGLTPERVKHLAEMGCRGVAVCAQICGSEDPREAAKAFLSALRQGAARGGVL